MLRACLVESRTDGAYGGTGRSAPWETLRDGWRAGQWPPLVLAGGLNPDNVATAIQTVRPWGVDVASGVELRPGVKDLDLVRRFIASSRAAS
jgi:phosphoribosylanthranilate isomerase